MHRPTLGLVAVLFLLVGASLWFYPLLSSSEAAVSPGLGGMLLRVGIVLGLFWLAWPDLARFSVWLLGGVVAGCVVLAAGGWYYIVVALGAAAVAWFLMGRAGPAKTPAP